MAEHTDRISPLAGYAGAFAATGGTGAELAELAFCTQLNLRLDPKGDAAERVALALGAPLPSGPNTCTRAGTLTICWLGPDEWLLLGEPDRAAELAARVSGALGKEFGSVVDVSASRTTIRLAGLQARDVLAHGCALDLHPRVFGPGQCAQTLLARAGVLLIADDDGAWRILVRSSFARYLADWLLDASLEYRGPALDAPPGSTS
ncbi:MAG: sarcosine oxidase subunit gamma [Streptosporangiaceae bacterium]